MDLVEADIRRVLNGKGCEESRDFCDFTLMDQSIESKATKGVDSGTCKFIPICKQNVFYIVMAVLINDRDEVLMMQEAKSECAGTWYLPAGRTEPGENLMDAVRRQVLEETGLKFEPSTLVLVENAKGNWHRFVFTGSVCGGHLKTVAQADSESLQATWVSDVNQLSLRGRDILSIIDKTRCYLRDRPSWHKPITPAVLSHDRLLLRLVMVIKRKSNNRLHVLTSGIERYHLPSCEINPVRSVHAALKRFVQYIFSNQAPAHRPHGLLSLEHSGFPMNDKDGLCLSILVSCSVAMEQTSPRDNFKWVEINEEIEQHLMDRLGKNKTLALNVI